MAWDTIEFDAGAIAHCEREWQDLFARADNPLIFASWHWLQSWWCSMPELSRRSLTVRVFVVRDETGRWLGLAPMVVGSIRRSGLPVRCMQFMGGAYGQKSIFRTEYNDFLIDSDVAQPVAAELHAAIAARRGWDELVLADVPAGAKVLEYASGAANANLLDRIVADDLGYRAHLDQGFEHYLANLSGSARRHLFNKRKRLEKLGSVRLEPVTDDNWPDFVRILNAFHERRWGHPVIRDTRRKFLDQLLAGGAAPRQASSLLLLDERPISALLDIDYNGRRYNLQAGFDSKVDSAISPNLLHFGYSMEAAAADGIAHYEFLIGNGKHHNYKQSIATEEISAQSHEYVRSRWLRTLYAAHDLFLGSAGSG